jgi:pimeloyl-ACP methyl ester carboxylesterase
MSGGDVAERMIEVGAVELCTEPFGEPTDPPILLIGGLGASMLWWQEGFCRTLVAGGVFVIRYDHRDTGRRPVNRDSLPTAATTWWPTRQVSSMPTAFPPHTWLASPQAEPLRN